MLVPHSQFNPPTASSPPTMKRAFTLIELLVVVSIIALLIAILVPALTAAKARAQSGLCLSNIRQLIAASSTYAADVGNGSYFSGGGTVTDSAGTTWYKDWYVGQAGNLGSYLYDVRYGGLTPYCGSNLKLLACPIAVATMAPYFDPYNPGNQTPPLCSYGYANSGLLMVRVTSPSGTVAFGEFGGFLSNGTLIGLAPTASLSTTSQGIYKTGPNLWAPHQKSGAVGWMDGHASLEIPYTKLDSTDTGYSSNLPTLPYWQQHNFGYITPINLNTPTSALKTMPTSVLDQYFQTSP